MKAPHELECIGLLTSYFNGETLCFESQKRDGGDSKGPTVDEILRYSPEPLQRSLLRIEPSYEHEALEMFKLILYWMSVPNGKSQSEMKNCIVADILNKANILVGMENEVYLQLLKQTRGNWDANHEKNAWKLFGIISKEVTCTSGLYPCVSRYVTSVASCHEEDPLIRKLAFEVLQSMKEKQLGISAVGGNAPMAYHPLENVGVCSVLLQDGSLQEVAFDSATTVLEALLQVCWSVGCQRPENFALIADFGNQRELLEDDCPLEKILRSSEVRRNEADVRIQLKRVMFRLADHRICDTDFINLLFAQAKKDYLFGDYALAEQQIAYLSALQILAEHDPSCAENDETLLEVVRDCIPENRLRERSVAQRAVNVVAALNDNGRLKSMEAKVQFLSFFEGFSFENSIACPIQLIGDRPAELADLVECYFAVDCKKIYFFWPTRDSHLLSFDLSRDISCERKGYVVHLKIAAISYSKPRTIKMKTSGASVLCRMINRYRNDFIKLTENEAARSGSVIGTPAASDLRSRARSCTFTPSNTEEIVQGTPVSNEIVSQGMHTEIMDTPTTVIADSDVEISNPWMELDGEIRDNEKDDPESVVPGGSPTAVSETTRLSLTMSLLRSFCSRKEKPKKKRSPGKEINSKLEILSKLTHGKTFARRYVITGERICEKSHIVCGITKTTSERVVLKFYTSRRMFENAKKMHERFSQSKRVCKLLDVIDDEGGFPLCLVFERGTHTLDQYLQRIKPVSFQRKSILLEVLLAIIEIHSHGVVHCDLKPSNIMISENHEWKMLDLDSAVMQMKPAEIKTTPFYCAPEVFKAALIGKKQIAVDTSADMWSFGVLAYELLTDSRFYGPDASLETVTDCLCGTSSLPNIDAIIEPQSHCLVSRLLSENPKERPTAKDATEHAIFKSGDTSAQIAARFGEVTKALNMLLTLQKLDLRKASKATLLMSITVESFKPIEGGDVAFDDAPGREAPTVRNVQFVDDPFFVMKVGNSHRLRLCLLHERTRSVPVDRIVSAKIIDSDETPLDLVIRQLPSIEGKREAVAYLDPKIFNLNKLLKEAPPIGELNEKYVPLPLVIAVKMLGDDSLQELKHTIYCKIISPQNKASPERFIRTFQNGWEDAPEWMQDVARGSVVFASVGVRTY